jgi:CRP-like cAMP-binding protein
VTADLSLRLAAHRFLEGLDTEDVALLAAVARPAEFPAGTYLIREGEEADTIYFVDRGRVAIELHAPGRGPLVVETVGPGQVVGLSWVSPPFRWQFDARAAEAVGAVGVDAPALRLILAERPVLGFDLLQRLSGVLLERLQTTRVRLLDLYGDGGRR